MEHQLDKFQVIADATRRQILQLLSKEGQTINAIANNFDISRPAISKHIKILNENGFISIQEMGRERICHLKKDGFDEIQKWIAYYDSFWKAKLVKLENILNQK